MEVVIEVEDTDRTLTNVKSVVDCGGSEVAVERFGIRDDERFENARIVETRAVSDRASDRFFKALDRVVEAAEAAREMNDANALYDSVIGQIDRLRSIRDAFDPEGQA